MVAIIFTHSSRVKLFGYGLWFQCQLMFTEKHFPTALNKMSLKLWKNYPNSLMEPTGCTLWMKPLLCTDPAGFKQNRSGEGLTPCIARSISGGNQAINPKKRHDSPFLASWRIPSSRGPHTPPHRSNKSVICCSYGWNLRRSDTSFVCFSWDWKVQVHKQDRYSGMPHSLQSLLKNCRT